MTIKTHRSKSYSRRHTRKNGGGCGCAMRGQWGGRGISGASGASANVGHAFTTGASQTLYQITGRTPVGGTRKRTFANRQPSKVASRLSKRNR